MNFRELHQQVEPLILCNVWDVPSAKIAEKLGFQAIGTSSGAIASMLGYEDGEEMSFTELLYIVRRIVHNVKLPVSVDIEAGYSRDPDRVVNHIEQLTNSGVVGVNIEDSIPSETRTQSASDEFSRFLSDIKLTMKKRKIEMFINARTDAFLLGKDDALSETMERIAKYEQAGADGIFIPCITKEDEIRTVVESTSLPVNVMCMPELPEFEKLQQLGVKRISMGGFVQKKMLEQLENDLLEVKSKGNFTSIFEN